ncbi:GNAT family N-acetyltransferase [Litoreibacter janthinus]|nr:GNAT family N-acetyltransferase [Litoreibacter janthinus]
MQGELHVLSGDGVCIPFELIDTRVRGISTRVLRVLGDPMADQFFVTQATGVSWSELMEGLSRAPTCDMIVLSELQEMPPDQTASDRGCGKAGFAALWRQCGNAPVVVLNQGGKALEFSDYSSTLRNRLKRGRKKMTAAGDMQVAHYLPTPEEVDDLLATLKSIEDDSWKGDEDTGLFRDDRLDFVRDISEGLAAKGELEIYIMSLDGTAISYRYGFRHEGRFLDYNLAYREAFSALSPGRILLDEIVKTSQVEGLEAVDASRGSMIRPHILADWPSDIRPHYRLTLYRPTIRGRLLHFLETRAKPLAQKLRSRFSRS